MYLDIDRGISKPLDSLIHPTDIAVLSRERYPHFFV
ncbi:glycosyltransferase family 32 protein [Elizabethkingia meningoseptica]